MNSQEQQQIQEEAHYWFCLNDVADYVELLGTNQVIKDSCPVRATQGVG